MTEQDDIIARFNAARERGLKPEDAIAGLGPKLASVYRWRREREPARGKPAPTIAQEISIEQAIACLADQGNKDRLSLLEALFKLIAWLRWPMRPADHPAAITACVVNYVSQKDAAHTIDQLSKPNAILLQRHLQLETLRRMCSEDFLIMPIFTPIPVDDKHYTQQDVMADLAWFILAFEPVSSHIRDSVSLEKAIYIFQKNYSATPREKHFSQRWNASPRTFRSYWLANGAAAPLLYIERFHSGLDLSLDPNSKDFSEQVDSIIGRRAELRRYLAQSRWAVETLRARLDRRSVAAVRFPDFPPTLSAEEVTPEPLKAITKLALREYGNAYKRL